MNKAGDDIKAQNANWKFSGDMVESFDTHVKKSVPLYDEGHTLISNLSDYFIKDDSICYELGSSTGVLLEKLANRHSFRDTRFIGIELEEDMVKKADKRSSKNLSFICDDIKTYELEKSDMIISYYTMQFIHPKHRQLLFDKIYDSLNWGGAFVLYEKVRANDARFQDILTGLYTEFKLDNGYSADEILAKSQSLKGVLEPFSTKGNLDLLKRAGFVDVISVQKFMNFEGFLAIK
jgi:tRNA (cmo5U34)-methyltransferase